MNFRLIVIFTVLFSSFQLNSYACFQSGKIIISENNTVSNSGDLKSTQYTTTVSGTVYAGINPLPEGQVYLLNKNKTSFITSSSQEINEGEFQFKDINFGEYILYVIPEFNYDFLYFPKYIPTYSGKTYTWQKAINSDVSMNNFTVDLHLLSFQKPFYGEKTISGKIKFRGTYNGVENLPVPVILLNSSHIPMDFRIADKKSGKFTFEHIPEGTYYIHPEIPGLKTSDYRIHIIGNHSDKYDNVNFSVDNENVKIEKQSDEIVPVVSGEFLRVFLKDNLNYPVVCELIDLSGKIITKKVFYNDEILMNTSGMAANLYILKVKTYDNSPVKTAKVFIRNY